MIKLKQCKELKLKKKVMLGALTLSSLLACNVSANPLVPNTEKKFSVEGTVQAVPAQAEFKFEGADWGVGAMNIKVPETSDKKNFVDARKSIGIKANAQLGVKIQGVNNKFELMKDGSSVQCSDKANTECRTFSITWANEGANPQVISNVQEIIAHTPSNYTPGGARPDFANTSLKNHGLTLKFDDGYTDPLIDGDYKVNGDISLLFNEKL